MRFPLYFKTASTRFERLAIVRSTTSIERLSNDLKTGTENCLNVSEVIHFAIASCSRFSSPSGKCFRLDSSLVILGWNFVKLGFNILHCLSCSFFSPHLAKQRLKCCLTKFFKETTTHFFVWNFENHTFTISNGNNQVQLFTAS